MKMRLLLLSLCFAAGSGQAQTISISPKSATVEVGASKTFQRSSTAKWTSSDTSIATVSSVGVVKAKRPGQVLICVTLGGPSACAIVTVPGVVVVPPPPPPPPPPVDTTPAPPLTSLAWRANEPAGMTQIVDRPFNAVVEGGFDPYGSNAFSIVSNANGPHSPPSAMRATYPPGFEAGQAPAHSGIAHASYSKIYICFAVRLSANWVGNGSGVNKYLYEWTTVPHPSFFFAAYGTGSLPLEPRVMFQDMVVSPNPGFVSPNLVPDARIIRGQWQTIEIYIQGNTAGNADGVVDWYLDGVHIGHVASGVQFSSGATAFNVFEIYPIWGGGNTSPAITQTQTLDFDHLYVSGRN